MRRELGIGLAAAAAAASGAVADVTTVFGQRPGALEPGWRFANEDRVGALGDDFMLAEDATILSATFWGFEVPETGSGLPDAFTVAFWEDTGGGLPDDASLIFEEEFAIGDLGNAFAFGAREFTANFTTPFDLAADTAYWFSVGYKGGDKDFVLMWQGLSSPDPIGESIIAIDFDYDGWDGLQDSRGDPQFDGSAIAFSLTGDTGPAVIPLPTASAMAGIGMLSLGLRRRRRNAS